MEVVVVGGQLVAGNGGPAWKARGRPWKVHGQRQMLRMVGGVKTEVLQTP